MLAKPFNLILVFIVTSFNIAILSCPLIALLIPFIDRRSVTLQISDSMIAKFQLAIFFILFLVSFFMLLYLFLDMLFGFAMRASLKNCQRYEKNKDYDFLSGIFEETKEKFGQKHVKLYIKNSDEINAFAVASFGGKAIVLTSGIINHYLEGSQNSKEFLYAIRSIMGHEMSHLINKDFLPTYLIIANQKATNCVAFFLGISFNYIARFFAWMPYGGRITSNLMIEVHNILHFVFSIFNRVVVFNVYEFLRKFVSRSLEYRCDRQSAYAFGGRNMAFALQFLGESGYFTLFSTHPATKKRIDKVRDVEIKDSVVSPSFLDAMSNYFSIMFLIVICLFLAKKAGVDLLLRTYIRNHHEIHLKLMSLWSLLSKFL